MDQLRAASRQARAVSQPAPRRRGPLAASFEQRWVAAPVADSAAIIQLVENKNDIILYESNSATNQFAVFSEVYYTAGWNAFIDGKKTEIVKTNYALRGLAVPAGKHKIEFRFEPKSYELGDTLSFVSVLLVYLIVFAGLFMTWKTSKQA